MKKILFVLFNFVFSTYSFAQVSINGVTINEEGSNISKIFSSNIIKDKKHINAKEWVAKTYGDYKSVVQFEDDNNCKLIIKGRSSLPERKRNYENIYSAIDKPYFVYTLTVDSKDDKYRIQIEDMSINIYHVSNILGKINTEIINKTIKESVSQDSVSLYIKEVMPLELKREKLNSADRSTLKKKEVKLLEEELYDMDKKIRMLKESIGTTMCENRKMKEDIQLCIYMLFKSLANAIEKNDDF